MKVDDPRMVFAAALGRIPSGLFILTAGRGAHGSGMLASWVQQCSFDPPQVSVAVKPGRHVATMLARNEPFVLNQLADGQSQFLTHFGRGVEPGEPAFDGIDLEIADGPAILSAALAHLHCLVVERISVGDHELVIGRIVSGRLHRDDLPFIHTRKNGLHY